MTPYFSIVIPVYNRERYIDRCLQSVLRQEFSDYEIVAVDDGSADGSAARIRAVAAREPRLRLLQHAVNRGMQPARITGIEAATGPWIALLDSDDELLPGALGVMHQRLQTVADDIHAVAFTCRMDSGQLSPDPAVDMVRDYRGYLEFAESHFDRPTAALDCLRRGFLAELPMEEKKGYEELYLLEYHARYKSQVFSDVCRLYHQDADNQLVKAAAHDPRRDIRLARDRLAVLEAVLDHHGEALRRHAPRTYWQTASRLAALQFLVGERRRGLHYGWLGIRARPGHLRSWAVPALGLLGTGVLQRARSAAQRLQRA